MTDHSLTIGRSAFPAPERLDAEPAPPAERDAFWVELREAAASIGRRRLHIAVGILMCLWAAFLAIALLPSAYLGTAQVLLDPRALKVTDSEVVPPSGSAEMNDAIVETQLRLLTSEGVLAGVVESLGLDRDPDYAARDGLRAKLKAAFGLGDAKVVAADPIGAAAAVLGRQLTVQRQGKSFAVTVSVRAGEPVKAARIASAVVRVFLADLDRRRRAVVTQARDAMTATLTGQRERLARAEEAVERYKRSVGIVDADGRVLNTARLAELSSQLLAARAATRSLAARLQQLESLGRAGAADRGSDVVESQLLTTLKASRAETMRQQENLRTTLGSRHPQVLEIDAQVRSLNRAITAEIGRLVAAAQSDYKSAVAREQSLGRDVARTETETATTNGALVELRQLEREAGAQRIVYEKFLERERELRELENAGLTNASILTDAKPSSDPVGVKPILLLAAALGLGLFGGCGIAIASDRLNGRVFSAERLVARTGLEVVGTLPIARTRPGPHQPLVSLLGPGRSSPASRTLYSISDGLDAVATGAPLTLLVVSPAASQARRTVATNLALAEATRGRRALLVHADPEPGEAWLVPEAGIVSCSVDGSPAFSAVAAGEDMIRRLADDGALRAIGMFDRIVVDASGGMEELGLRRLADAATAILVVVESGRTTYAELGGLEMSLARNARKVVGALMVEPGRDAAVPARTEVAALPEKTWISTVAPLRTGHA